jgi:hypothetical protein
VASVPQDRARELQHHTDSHRNKLLRLMFRTSATLVVQSAVWTFQLLTYWMTK